MTTLPQVSSYSDAGIVERLDEFIRFAEVKRLVSSVALLQKKRRFRILAVISFLAGEGRTLLCAALARAYAQAYGRQILVVDAAGCRDGASLALRACLIGAANIDFLSLSDQRREETRNSEAPEGAFPLDIPRPELDALAGDALILEKASDEWRKRYNLVLIDTVPLTASNKRNFDPVLAARRADASALVVSRKFLDSPEVDASLKLLADANIRLIGMVANEEFER